ncbi:hypothetical protein SeMB42_g00063 [Synchytrium endobioticum]|uniref:HMG box domain-containing protein n=1 Tax=Synchytrium endobioticum TaxID=286115 RepID=A0A507D3N6_9FUNG|nr:hypothetical protein SeLEV6574_g03536 [Synchytrium endobioticum]TPX55020.1 hypothetical protein SeMB42_g00063 [Synchytrium endobioticum]
MLLYRFPTRASPSVFSSSTSIVVNRLHAFGINLSRHLATAATTADDKSADEEKAKRKVKVARVQLKALPKTAVPERPPSAYILFAQDARKQILQQLGGSESKPSFVQIANAIGKKYKELDASEKERYAAKAAELRKEYDDKLARYLETRSPLDVVVEKYRTKLLKTLHPAKKLPRGRFADPNAPAYPLSPYGFFVKEVWAMSDDQQAQVVGRALKDLPIAETSKLSSGAWNNMSEADKEKYVKLGKKSSETYAEAKNKYEESLHDAREEVKESMKQAVAATPGLRHRKKITRKATTSKKPRSTVKKTRKATTSKKPRNTVRITRKSTASDKPRSTAKKTAKSKA